MGGGLLVSYLAPKASLKEAAGQLFYVSAPQRAGLQVEDTGKGGLLVEEFYIQGGTAGVCTRGCEFFTALIFPQVPGT